MVVDVAWCSRQAGGEKHQLTTIAHSAMPWRTFPERISAAMFQLWCSESTWVTGLAVFRYVSAATCQLQSTQTCVSHLDGIRDVSKALFQLWLSSHVPAMALRVNLDLRPQSLPRCVSVQTKFLPWFLTSIYESGFNHWGSTLSLLWAQALSLPCLACSVPRAFDRRFNLSRRARPEFPCCGASLSVSSTTSLTSASKEHSMSGHVSIVLQVGLSPRFLLFLSLGTIEPSISQHVFCVISCHTSQSPLFLLKLGITQCAPHAIDRPCNRRQGAPRQAGQT